MIHASSRLLNEAKSFYILILATLTPSPPATPYSPRVPVEPFLNRDCGCMTRDPSLQDGVSNSVNGEIQSKDQREEDRTNDRRGAEILASQWPQGVESEEAAARK
jgi:hypothetical protein